MKVYIQLIGSDKIGKKTFVDSLDLKRGWKRAIEVDISDEVYKIKDFYLLMFDLSDEKSYSYIKNYFDIIDKNKYIVIGNKSDIQTFEPDINFIKISTKYQQNITEPINEIFKRL